VLRLAVKCIVSGIFQLKKRAANQSFADPEILAFAYALHMHTHARLHDNVKNRLNPRNRLNQCDICKNCKYNWNFVVLLLLENRHAECLRTRVPSAYLCRCKANCEWGPDFNSARKRCGNYADVTSTARRVWDNINGRSWASFNERYSNLT